MLCATRRGECETETDGNRMTANPIDLPPPWRTEPMSLNMIYEKDASLDALKGKTVAIIGFGSQGHAHGLNLRDSGVKVVVANRKESPNGKLAIEHGFELLSVEDAVKAGDLLIVTLPDEVQPDVYGKSIA